MDGSRLGSTALAVTGSVLIKPGLGQLMAYAVLTTGGGTIALHDAATVGGVSSATQIAAIVANAAGAVPVNFGFQFSQGLVVVAGAEKISLYYF